MPGSAKLSKATIEKKAEAACGDLVDEYLGSTRWSSWLTYWYWIPAVGAQSLNDHHPCVVAAADQKRKIVGSVKGLRAGAPKLA